VACSTARQSSSVARKSHQQDEMMPLHVEASFDPREDITAYELTVIVQKVSGFRSGPIRFTTEQWQTLDPVVKRHFVQEG
jgi:hypothetical protein